MDEKVKELIALGASVGAHCQPCLRHHVTKAREAGLTESEIREAIAVGHMVEKGAMSAMRQFSTELFEAPESQGKNCAAGAAKGGGCCG